MPSSSLSPTDSNDSLPERGPWRLRSLDPDTVITLLVFWLALSLYLAFLTVHHSYDAVAGGILIYQWLASGSVVQLFHKYHILYLPLAALVDSGLEAVGIAADPLTLLQMLNAIFAAGTVALYYRLARNIGLGRPIALLIVTLFGGSFSFWYYATNAESYAPSLFFVLFAFVAAFGRGNRRGDRAERRRPWLAGLATGLASGFHLTCILTLPAVALAASLGRGRRDGLRTAALVAMLAVIVAMTPYAMTYLVFESTDPISGFSSDLSSSLNPSHGPTNWWSFEPGNILRQWWGLMRAIAPTDWPAAGSSFSLLPLVAQFGLLLLLLASLVLLLPRGQRAPRTFPSLLVWFLPVFVFFATYNVASVKFASYQWAPLLLIVGLGLNRMRTMPILRISGYGFAAVLTAGVLVSSFDVIRQQTAEETNPHLVAAQAIAKYTTSEDLVVHLGRGDTVYQKVYTPYFAVRPSLVLDYYFDRDRRSGRESMKFLAARLAEHAVARQGRVIALSDVVEESSSHREFEAVHGLAPGDLGRFFAAYRPEVLAEDPALGRLWVLHDIALEMSSEQRATFVASPDLRSGEFETLVERKRP